jgi:hypothetical protein
MSGQLLKPNAENMNADEFNWAEERLEALDAEMLGDAAFNRSAGFLGALPPGVVDPCETTVPPNPVWLNASAQEQQAQWRRNDQEWMPAWD